MKLKTKNVRKAWKDFKFTVEPLSKINIKQIQKAMRLIKKGDIEGWLKHMGLKKKELQVQILRNEDLNHKLLFPVVSDRKSYEILLGTMNLYSRDAIEVTVKLAWFNGMAEALRLGRKVLDK